MVSKFYTRGLPLYFALAIPSGLGFGWLGHRAQSFWVIGFWTPFVLNYALMMLLCRHYRP